MPFLIPISEIIPKIIEWFGVDESQAENFMDNRYIAPEPPGFIPMSIPVEMTTEELDAIGALMGIDRAGANNTDYRTALIAGAKAIATAVVTGIIERTKKPEIWAIVSEYNISYDDAETLVHEAQNLSTNYVEGGG